MKKILLLLIIFVILIVNCFATPKRIMQLPELINPTSMAMDNTRIFIVDGPAVMIYSIKRSDFINKIGKEGEGPGEFKVAPNLPITINLINDSICISSLGKVSIYTKDGKFIREIRNKSMAINLIPCSNLYLGKGFAQSNGQLYHTVNIYDGQLNKIKEIYREKSGFQLGSNQKFDPIDATGPGIAAHLNYLFLNIGENRNTLAVFDLKGNMKYSFTHKFREIKLTDERIKRYMSYLETDPNFKTFVARVKHLLKFEEILPLVQYFFIDDGKIYITSYENHNSKRDLYMFSLKGQFLKKMELPLVSRNVDIPYPFTIIKGKLFQIVENENNESWELFLHQID